MTAGLTKIGDGPWNREEMLDDLAEFADLYERRPIRDNEGGMRSPHLFAFWFAMRQLRPAAVIESGVWRGQGTWFIEQACPKADIYCVDINWSNLSYRSSRATYLTGDFTKHDWARVPKQETLLFLDDHMNAVQRCHQALAQGFRHLIFEDNYFPPENGDCYSLKAAFAHAGFRPRSGWRSIARRLLGNYVNRTVRPNAEDAIALREIIEVYEEVPPVVKADTTRWGDPWREPKYPTPAPLIQDVSKAPNCFSDEAQQYTWLCYVRLKEEQNIEFEN